MVVEQVLLDLIQEEGGGSIQAGRLIQPAERPHLNALMYHEPVSERFSMAPLLVADGA